jgi:hypothetical protein
MTFLKMIPSLLKILKLSHLNGKAIQHTVPVYPAPYTHVNRNYIRGHIYQDFIVTTHYYIVFYLFNHSEEKNQCIREKTRAQNIVQEIKHYQKKWLQHVQRMDTNRIPRQELRYRPEGRRNVGRPKKRWRDQIHFEN